MALLPIIVVFVGAPAYRTFGAGESMAALEEAGSWMPAVITVVIAFVFALFGLAAWLFGAGHQPGWLRYVLIGIAGIYTLRGLAVSVELFGWLTGINVPIRMIVFSGVSLAIGVVHWLRSYQRNPA